MSRTRLAALLALAAGLILFFLFGANDNESGPGADPEQPQSIQAAVDEYLSEGAPELAGRPGSVGPVSMEAAADETQPVEVEDPVRFTVLDWDGDPVEGVVVTVDAMGYETDPRTGSSRTVWLNRARGVTNEKGLLEIASADIHREQPATLRWLAVPPFDRDDVQIAGRGGVLKIEDQTVQLRHAHCIAGVVVDRDGKPFPHVIVNWTSNVAGPKTDEKGRFRIRRLPESTSGIFHLSVREVVYEGRLSPNYVRNTIPVKEGDENVVLVVEPWPEKPGLYRPVR